ncbi:uncharacterized protein F4807DRAFT_472382 [Annulohypoxylon truncatum]|uniref:uncharacterized protein n=1 Tax=Annulohypoxylon truncatum TaxID=327061 RepID=UPI0020079B68|nr:uncharacterized protein F4807DRAFT_472382 [Annulohypoxylon truncatum]KAI1204232.1 hypothetical protein F4807DRAFT_472382 [Annulohypoxylon truncatum]
MPSEPGSGQESTTYEYTCLLSPCTRDVCVIHGRPSSAELSARIPHEVGGYYPENPQKSCELDNCGIHVNPKRVFSIHPEGINRIRQDEQVARLPISDTLGMKKDVVAEKGGLIGRSTSPSSSATMFSEQLEWTEIDGEKFVKPAKWYILSVVEKSDDLGIPPNLDFVSKIFSSEEERAQAFEAHRRDTVTRYDETPPLMLTYGIQYAPEPGHYSVASSRKVFITGIDPTMPMWDIMAGVRGGKILKVTAAISPMPIDYTVIIEFVDAHDAKAYVNYVADKTADVFHRGVEVTLFKSHSYPISMGTENDLRQKFTRQIVYLDFSGYSPKDFLHDFEARFRKPEDVLEDLWLDDHGRLWILFQSIEYASRFYKQTIRELERERPGAFDDDMYRFAPDPCDMPLDDMQEPVQLARGSHRSLLEAWIEGKLDSEEEHVEVGRAAPPKEEALSTVIPHRPHAPSGSGALPTIPLIPSTPEPPKEIRGLGTGMWSRPWFLDAVRKLDGPEYETFPKGNEFRRHRAQSQFMYRRHRRDPSVSRSTSPNKPGNGQGFSLEKFAEEQMRIRYGQDSDPTTPTNSLLTSDVDYVKQSILAIEKADLEKTGAEIILHQTGVTATQSPREASGPKVGESNNRVGFAPVESSLFSYCDEVPRVAKDVPMVAKSKLPQNDPAFTELLNREPGDFVSRAEAEATLWMKKFRSYSKDEMLALYGDPFASEEALRAWNGGEEYDLEAAPKAEHTEREEKEQEDKECEMQ